MSSENIQLSLSQLSLDPTTSHGEDWEHSPRGDSSIHQNSVAFPGEEGTGVGRDAPTSVASNPKRTLSELLKLHAEKGTEVVCSAEEASRLADVLGQWVCELLFDNGRYLRYSYRSSFQIYTGVRSYHPFASITCQCICTEPDLVRPD